LTEAIVSASRAEGSPAELDADGAVVATGSAPIFPPKLKPDGRRIIGPRFVSQMRSLPSSLIMVGGGITGAESIYAFNRPGVAVTWLVDEFGVLPPFEPRMVNVLVAALEHRGVVRYEGGCRLGRCRWKRRDGHSARRTIVPGRDGVHRHRSASRRT
jgi:pyruvate/2-oxoglutarate dehydrogenase complex dihydrolipoamide dehydrogenase (E3) component